MSTSAGFFSGDAQTFIYIIITHSTFIFVYGKLILSQVSIVEAVVGIVGATRALINADSGRHKLRA